MDTKTTVTNKADATEAYKAAESALFYADSVTRFLTHRTLKLIDTAISTGNPDALLLRAVRYRDMNENAFQYLCEAMLRGCTQLRIYTNLGLCYYQGNEGVGRDEAKAFECFEKAIQGGSVAGLMGVYKTYKNKTVATKGDPLKSMRYLLDVEMTGVSTTHLWHHIGENYSMTRGAIDVDLAMAYYTRSHELGFTTSTCGIFERWMATGNIIKAIRFILEEDSKGIHDGRLLQRLLCQLEMYDTSLDMVIGDSDLPYNSAKEIAQYCISSLKTKEVSGFHRNPKQAVEAWEEADRLGLADVRIYRRLVGAYKGLGHSDEEPNGAKVLEYCEKAIQVAYYPSDKPDMYDEMAEVYEFGTPHVTQDLGKARDLREKASLLHEIAQTFPY